MTCHKYISIVKKFCDIGYTILKDVNSSCSEEGEFAVGDTTKRLMNESTLLFLKCDLPDIIKLIRLVRLNKLLPIPFSHPKKTPNS